MTDVRVETLGTGDWPTEQKRDTEGRGSGLLRRTFDVELTAGDGRTVDVRIVPFGEVARVADPPDFRPYDEEWMPGVFDHQLNAANRVLANFEHQQGLQGVVGHGLELRKADDGYHGSFRVHETPDGDKALVLIREKVLHGVSLEAWPVKNIRTAAGVMQRVKANLKAIAFCRDPAFTGAQVLAVRTEPETTLDEELLPVELDPELVDRCRRLGIKLPQRLEAHPANGHPGETGTPEDGTRPETTETTSLEV